jgi:adenosine kinase
MTKNPVFPSFGSPGRILVSGSLAFDRVMDFAGRFSEHINPEKIHVINLSFAVSDLALSLGGTAGNIAYNLALLKVPTAVIGNLGKDGQEYLYHLQALGLDTAGVKVTPNEFTAGAYIITDRADNQIAGFFAGAMAKPSKLPRCQRGDWAIIAADWPANMLRLCRHFRKNGVPYIFDPGQNALQFTGSQLKYCISNAAVVIGNDYEMDLMRKRSGCRPQAGQFFVTTLGEKGSQVVAGPREFRIRAAYPRKVVDPTGAGDAYRAGLIKGLIMGYAIDKAAKLASVVAVHAVEKKGTQKHGFTWQGLEKRYFKNYKERL